MRPGTQHFGHRRLLTFRGNRGIQHATAHDRKPWASHLSDWLHSCGLPDVDHLYNVQWVPETQRLGMRWRDVIPSTLTRRDGWLHWELWSSELVNVCTAVLSQLLSRTLAVRLLVVGSLQSVCKAACFCFVEGLAAQQVVVGKFLSRSVGSKNDGGSAFALCLLIF